MKIALGEFKDNGEELAEFLEPRIGVKPKSSGDGLEIDDDSVRKAVKPRHVKTYIKRFLLMKDQRQDYKILVDGTDLTMIYLESDQDKEEKEEEKKREATKAKREEKEEAEESTPEQAKEAETTEKANDAKEAAVAETKEAVKEEGALKQAPTSKQPRKSRKKA
ncbi:MAG: hypothetical protein OK456_03675 [Thaumarchaeota archaeon]|nr:hypothetical protein [Nitrososphaerota archaeon]